MGHWKNRCHRWIQTPQRILMDPCIKQVPVLSKRFWIIPWPLAYNRLELHCVRKIINFWYTFGWKWRVFVTIWDCRTHVRMTSMTSSVEWTNLDFKISVALIEGHIIPLYRASMETAFSHYKSMRILWDSQGQLTPYSVVWSGWNLNSFEILCMSLLPASIKRIGSKTTKKGGDIIFPIISQWGLSVAMETRVLIQSSPKTYTAFPPPQSCYT